MSLPLCAALIGLALLSLAACTTAPESLAPEQEWQRLADMPTGVFKAAASVVGRRAVVTGGVTQFGGANRLVQVLDMAVGVWTVPLKLAVGRFDHAQVTLADGRVLVVGGHGGRVPNAMTPLAGGHIIDLEAGTITAVPDLPQAAPYATAHLLSDGQVVVISGSHAAVFDPATNQWIKFIELHSRRRAHASVLLTGDRVLVAGGAGCDGLELVDVAAGVSRAFAARLPRPLDDLRMVVLPNERVLVLGGQDTGSGDTTAQTWVVDVRHPARVQLAPGPALGIPGGVADHCVVQLGRWVLIVGGETQRDGEDTELDTALLLDVKTLQVQPLPSLAAAHDDAVMVPFGRGVIVLGGYHVQHGFLGALDLPIAGRRVESWRLSDSHAEALAPPTPGSGRSRRH